MSLIGWLGNIYWLKKMFSRCEHGKIIIIIIQHSVNTCATGLSYERGHSSWRCENCQNRYGNKVVGKQQTPGLPCNPYLEMKLWSIVSQKRLSPSHKLLHIRMLDGIKSIEIQEGQVRLQEYCMYLLLAWSQVYMIKIIHMSELQIKNRSERDLCSCE